MFRSALAEQLFCQADARMECRADEDAAVNTPRFAGAIPSPDLVRPRVVGFHPAFGELHPDFLAIRHFAETFRTPLSSKK
jgi:hypothetical protein